MGGTGRLVKKITIPHKTQQKGASAPLSTPEVKV